MRAAHNTDTEKKSSLVGTNREKRLTIHAILLLFYGNSVAPRHIDSVLRHSLAMQSNTGNEMSFVCSRRHLTKDDALNGLPHLVHEILCIEGSDFLDFHMKCVFVQSGFLKCRHAPP